MKKVIIFLFLVFILSGCTADYTIDIDNGFNETLSISPSDAEEYSVLSKETYRNPAFYDPNYFEEELEVLPEMERYNTSFSNNKYYASYKFKDKYEDSNVANTALEQFSIYNTYYSKIDAEDFTPIFSQNETLSQVNVNIRTSKQVLGHNADFVNGNTYTWVIYRANPKRTIQFSYINPDYKDLYENYKPDPVNPTPDDNPDPDPSNDPTSSDDPVSNDDKKEEKREARIKRNNIILYVLYSLFFGLIFVIIVFRNKFKR